MHESILNLIADLYSQIGHLGTENQQLRAEIDRLSNEQPPSED